MKNLSPNLLSTMFYQMLDKLSKTVGTKNSFFQNFLFFAGKPYRTTHTQKAKKLQTTSSKNLVLVETHTLNLMVVKNNRPAQLMWEVKIIRQCARKSVWLEKMYRGLRLISNILSWKICNF